MGHRHHPKTFINKHKQYEYRTSSPSPQARTKSSPRGLERQRNVPLPGPITPRQRTPKLRLSQCTGRRHPQTSGRANARHRRHAHRRPVRLPWRRLCRLRPLAMQPNRPTSHRLANRRNQITPPSGGTPPPATPYAPFPLVPCSSSLVLPFPLCTLPPSILTPTLTLLCTHTRHSSPVTRPSPCPLFLVPCPSIHLSQYPILITQYLLLQKKHYICPITQTLKPHAIFQ